MDYTTNLCNVYDLIIIGLIAVYIIMNNLRTPLIERSVSLTKCICKESNQKDSWRAIRALLRSDLECPVCLDPLKPLVKQCRNGHITCSTCAERTGVCSLCQQNYLENSPVFANNLLAVLPRPCQYSNNGCEELCLTNDGHEVSCDFHALLCNLDGCEISFRINELYNHLKQRHPSTPVISSNEGNIVFRDFDPAVAPSQDRRVFIFLQDQTYALCFKNVTNVGLSVSLIFSPVNKSKAKFNVNVRFELNKYSFESTLLPVNTCDQDIFHFFDEVCGRPTVIPYDLLMQLVSSKKALSFSYRIFKVNGLE